MSEQPTRARIEEALLWWEHGSDGIFVDDDCSVFESVRHASTLAKAARQYLASLDAPAPSLDIVTHELIETALSVPAKYRLGPDQDMVDRAARRSLDAPAPSQPERYAPVSDSAGDGSPKDGTRESNEEGYFDSNVVPPKNVRKPAPPVPQEGVSEAIELHDEIMKWADSMDAATKPALPSSFSTTLRRIAPLLEENASLRDERDQFMEQASLRDNRDQDMQEIMRINNELLARVKELELRVKNDQRIIDTLRRDRSRGTG